MKCSPQNPNHPSRPHWALLCVAFAVSGLLYSAAVSADEQEQPAAADANANQQTADDAKVVDQTGDDILTQVREKLSSLDSLSCDLHQTVSFSGMQIIAAGRYVQASGDRVRLDFRLFPAKARQVGDQVSASPDGDSADSPDGPANSEEPEEMRGALTQVCDGNVLHTVYRNGEQVRVTRRNIRDVLAAARQSAALGADAGLKDLGVGGLRALLSRIQTDMEFAPVKESRIAEVRFYTLVGRWTPASMTRLFQVPEGTEVLPAEYLPEYVRILVDADSMLPRRIQYLKRSVTENETMVRPIVTLDLRNIELNKPLGNDVFAFSPPEGVSEEDVTDQTINLIQQLSTSPPSGTPPDQ